jgi:hypothetical protein
MRKILMSAGLTLAMGMALSAFGHPVHATTLTYGTLNVTGPNSTSASCPLPAGLQTPVAANTTICTIAVLPAGWQGTITNPSGGADSSKFAVVAVGGSSVLQNTVQLTNTGSAAGNGQYVIGTSTVAP